MRTRLMVVALLAVGFAGPDAANDANPRQQRAGITWAPPVRLNATSSVRGPNDAHDFDLSEDAARGWANVRHS